MVAKIHGGVQNGEALSGNLDFFTLKSLVALANGDVNTASPTAADNLDRLRQVIATRGQTVITSMASETVADPSAIGFGSSFSSSATMYTFRFSLEHAGSWSADTLATALDGLVMPFGGTPLNTSSATVKNVLITKSEIL